VLREEALGLLMRPLNGLAVVMGLRRPQYSLNETKEEDGDMMAAERAGVRVGSILVAVNGQASGFFDAAITKVKNAGRPVTLGFRYLHAVEDVGFRAKRLWQGYLFFRFSIGRTWTGRFYVLRDDGELRAYAGKDCREHVDELRVVLDAPVRVLEKHVAEAARAMGDLGDDGRGTLGPRVLAIPVHGGGGDLDHYSSRWALFRADSDDARDDWLMAFTTLGVVNEDKTTRHQSTRRSSSSRRRTSSLDVVGDADDDDDDRGGTTLTPQGGAGPPNSKPKKSHHHPKGGLAAGDRNNENNRDDDDGDDDDVASPVSLSPLLSSSSPQQQTKKKKKKASSAVTSSSSLERWPSSSSLQTPEPPPPPPPPRGEILRQGYLKMKISTTQQPFKEKVAAQAAMELATRLEPWRRRWFVLRGKQLKWYVSPPADASEVPSGFLKMARAMVSASKVEHEKAVYYDEVQSPKKTFDVFEFNVVQTNGERVALKLRCSAHDDGKEWVRVLRSAATDATDFFSSSATGGGATGGGGFGGGKHKASGLAAFSNLDAGLSRASKLQACLRDPRLVVEAPDVAYALLVPVDRHDAVDRDAWRDVAGKYLGPLCDDYVADVVYDALVGTNTDSQQPVVSHSNGVVVGEDHLQDHTTKAKGADFWFGGGSSKIKSSSSSSSDPRRSASPPPEVSAARGGVVPTSSVVKARLTKTYTAAKRLGVDASLKVSEFLATGENNKDFIARRQQADVKTSRREAEALTWRDLRLSDEAFRRYCESFRAVIKLGEQGWDDLRCRLGVDDLETLVLREDHVVDQRGDEGALFLTDRRLYLMGNKKQWVVVVDLNDLAAVDALRTKIKHPQQQHHHHHHHHHSKEDSCHILRLRFKAGLARHVHFLSLKPGGQPSTSSSSNNDAFLGDYPGGGKVFGNSVLRPKKDGDERVVHGGDADLSDADDDLETSDVAVVKGLLGAGPGLVVGENNDEQQPEQDEDSSSSTTKETPPTVTMTTSVHSSRVSQEARCFEDDCYALRLPKEKRAASSEERARRWLESLRELVAANGISSRFEQAPIFASRAAFEAAWRYYWVDVRADAKRFRSQREFFAADRRRLPLWVALNLIRREALARCCRSAPKRLLVCTHDRTILKRFLDRETCWRVRQRRRRPQPEEFSSAVATSSLSSSSAPKIGTTKKRKKKDDDSSSEDESPRLDASWLRAAVAYASRLEDLKKKRASDIETFSPARFRDEWTTFWHHVDPIWDGFFDTVGQLRRWDEPLASGVVFGTLFLVAVADKLEYLPSLLFASYAAAVVVNGNRAEKRRLRRRGALLQRRSLEEPGAPFLKGGGQQDKNKTIAAKASRTIRGFLFSSSSSSVVPRSSATREKASSLLLENTGNQQQQQQPEEEEDVVVDRSEDAKQEEDAPLASDDDEDDEAPRDSTELFPRPPMPPIQPAVKQPQTRLDPVVDQVFGVFGQLRELRAGLGRAQAKLHEYNTTLLKCRALHRWTDATRTSWFVAGLAAAAIVCACVPLNFLFGLAVLYYASEPLFTVRGLATAVRDEYFDGLPTASRTHGNVHFNAIKRKENPTDADVFPPTPSLLHFGFSSSSSHQHSSSRSTTTPQSRGK